MARPPSVDVLAAGNISSFMSALGAGDMRVLIVPWWRHRRNTTADINSKRMPKPAVPSHNDWNAQKPANPRNIKRCAGYAIRNIRSGFRSYQITVLIPATPNFKA